MNGCSGTVRTSNETGRPASARERSPRCASERLHKARRPAPNPYPYGICLTYYQPRRSFLDWPCELARAAGPSLLALIPANKGTCSMQAGRDRVKRLALAVLLCLIAKAASAYTGPLDAVPGASACFDVVACSQALANSGANAVSVFVSDPAILTSNAPATAELYGSGTTPSFTILLRLKPAELKSGQTYVVAGATPSVCIIRPPPNPQVCGEENARCETVPSGQVR